MQFLLFVLGLAIAAGLMVASATFKGDAKSLDKKIEDAMSSEDPYVSRKAREYEDERDFILSKSRAFRFGAIAAGIVFLLIGIIRIVPANSVAVPTSFGAIGQPVKSGLHVVAPWTAYHNFSTRIQESQRLASNEGDKKEPDCVKLNVGTVASADACVDVTVRYYINEKVAGRLYRRYGGFSEVNQKLVRREVESGLKEVYGDYNTTEAKSGKSLVEIQKKSKSVLGRNLARYGVKIDSVTIGDLKYTNPRVEANIAAKLSAEQEAEKAIIDQKTALTKADTRLKQADIDAKAEIARALGKAEANRRIAETLTPDLARVLIAEAYSQSGKANVNVIEGGNNTPVIVGGK
jgi:regulator of protease activity HflC (stomatin/prohibitin superfamily)